ncbi:hypothetical protein [Isachenkonia alkalipeptolytica]|uniref:Uncharacterized protein n=1 Tax=Isachenkonia alkalipeptolytica TaxID=2565777 RepID=A0AA44BEA0_9CLOT|nr:hypothetical protein [Isachenkonia alkalipeptolytica]NBG87960.1 hypothetical protein [Isachenkonia alkalipeptolytica]
MEKNSSSRLWAMYKKDVMNLRTESIFMLAFVLGINAFVYYQVVTTESTLGASGYGVLSSMVVFGALFLVFIRSFSLVSSEWKDNTLHMIMPLPIGGNTIFFSKLLAILTQAFIVGSISFGLTLGAVYMILELEDVQQIFNFLAMDSGGLLSSNIAEIFKMAGYGFISFASLIVIVFFSSVVGRMFTKLSGLITFVVFILSNVLLGQATRLVDSVVDFEQGSRVMYLGDPGAQMTGSMTFMGTPELLFGIFFTVGTSVLFFLATTYLYEKKVEL